MILCKLTDQNIQTYNSFQWVPFEWAPELFGDAKLCSNTIYHCYEHPLLAVLLNSIHANIKDPRLWLIETKGEPITDHGIKRGYRSMRLTEEIPIPEITTEQRITFAIRCALSVYSAPYFVAWAEKWLSGEDRSEATAWVATYETKMAWTAARAAWAPAAAWAAAQVAEAVARATREASAQATSVRASVRAEQASAQAVRAAAEAVERAVRAAAENRTISFSLINMVEKVIC